MTYTIKITITKPVTSIWYKQSSQYNPSIVAAISTWNKTSPGWISFVHNVLGDNISEELFTFDTEINAINWLDARMSHAETMVWRKYENDNGFVITEMSYQT